MLLDYNYRFYYFECEDQQYCFDAFSHKIFILKDDLKNLLENKNYKLIKKQYSLFYSSVLQKKPFTPKITDNKKCNTTINISNNCNLNCKYCYRDKTSKQSLSNKDLKEIMHYVTNVYYKNAEEYIFSLCYTSESSLDLEKLLYFDYLIGENEGYLFSKKQISSKKAKKIFNSLPSNIQNKYNTGNNYIETLNTILRKESLWNFFDISNNVYLVSSLNKTKNLSYSRRIMANRQVLNKTFASLKIEKKVHFFSMSFMTNGTNVTEEYINFIKSILLDTIYVSIDGPESIHNQNRILSNSDGTFNATLKGIKKLQNAGITVVPSVVITPANTNLTDVVSFLSSLGFQRISLNLSRGKSESSLFTKESMDILIDSIRTYYNKFYYDYEKGTISTELLLLKDTIIFSYLKKLYYRTYIISRCTWGKELVIDSAGNIYHCNSTIGLQNDYMGHYTENKKRKSFQKIPFVGNDYRCSKCYAKFLCGGTCYAEKLANNKQNEEMECYFHKNLVNESLVFYAKLKKHSLLDNFMKELIGY